MQPEITVLGLTIQTFGLMFGLGFLASGAVIARRLAEQGRPVDWAYEIVFAALIGGLVGARVWWLVQHWSEAKDDVFGSVFSGSGLVWYGGVLGGALGVGLLARFRGIGGLSIIDLCSPALALGYAIGRVGCQLAGDGDYGKPSDLPWAMAYPDGTVPTTDEVHPTPVYEALSMTAFAYVLWRLRDRFRPGALFGIYLVGAGVERFLIEFIRRNQSEIAGLTTAQLFSLALVAGGAAWLWHLARDGGLAPRARGGDGASGPGHRRATATT